jgi:hypothetical protein
MLGIIVGCLLSLFLVESAFADDSSEHIVGPKECGECHTAEVDIWRKTAHYRTFKELHRRKEAKKISKKLGIRRLKSESLCLSCHYTAKKKTSSLSAVAGVSCESCHGPAKDWLESHADYGGAAATMESETPEHKSKRLKTVDSLGMIRRDHLYKIAENCYRCHTTPNEDLVNKGGHPSGSDFELVAWLSGEVLHNVFYAKGSEKQKISIERQRLLYVVGAALDLEYALRGVAESTKKADYAVGMAKRAKRSSQRLLAISKRIKYPEVRKMIEVIRSVKLSLNNRQNLLVAAEKIKELGQEFAMNADGSAMAALDDLLPKPGEYKGTVYK